MNVDKEAKDKFNQLLNFSNNMDRNFDDITRDMRKYKETVKRKKMIDKMGGEFTKKKKQVKFGTDSDSQRSSLDRSDKSEIDSVVV
jgi:hypothetical protein